MKIESKVSAQLFCFHHAGGHSGYFKNWKKFLPASIEVIPIGLPGRHDRFREALITEFPAALEAMISMVVPLVSAPFALIGHSMGALWPLRSPATLNSSDLHRAPSLFRPVVPLIVLPKTVL